MSASSATRLHEKKPNWSSVPVLKDERSLEEYELSHWLGVGRASRVRGFLSAGGVKVREPHRGELSDELFTAEVLLDPDDVVRVQCRAKPLSPPREQLERSTGAPSCVRFASAASGTYLLAETRIDGAAHLPESLQAIRHGFRMMLDPVQFPPTESAGAITHLVNSAFENCGWPREDVVSTPQGHEVYLTLEGSRISVEAIEEPSSLLVRRAIVPSIPDGAADVALTDQALRINARLRGCRLAIHDGQLQVETRLHPPLIDAAWLEVAVRTVAAAALAAEPQLQLFVNEPAVVEVYLKLLEISHPPKGTSP